MFYYFFGIKWRLFIFFQLWIDSQIKCQSSTIKVYLQAFVNFEQSNKAMLLLMAESVYYNVKNASTGSTLFELNCSYYSCVFFEKNINPHFWSKTAKELSGKLRELMTVCWKNLYYT